MLLRSTAGFACPATPFSRISDFVGGVAVRLGVQSVRGVGTDIARTIEQGRPYASLEDLVRRVPALDLAHRLLRRDEQTQDRAPVRLRDDFEHRFHSLRILYGEYACKGIYR